MSQRLASSLLALAVFVLVAVSAVLSGKFPSFAGDFETLVLTSFVPQIGVFGLLRNRFAVLDTRVGEGTLESGDIPALFKISGLYVMLIGVGAAAYQLFGLGPFLSEATQAILIDGFVLIAVTLLDTFAKRTPAAIVQKAQAAAAKRYSVRARAEE